MALLTIPNVAIRGISACVPPQVEENREIPFYTAEEVEKVIASTGVERKHVVADSGITASDLCLQAAERLLDELGWERESIDLICNVTQTSDYINHPNAFVLHEKLGLSRDCMVVDLFHGCPGWVIGLSNVASLMSHGTLKRALLLDGDNITSTQFRMDRETRPLFGDAGSATALEFDATAVPINFVIGTNSEEGEALIFPKGGWRSRFSPDEYRMDVARRTSYVELSEDDVVMDGMSVFSFGITMPPKSIKQLAEGLGIAVNDVDKLVLHQANQFMVNKIAKKVKVDAEKVPTSLKDYGNTTSVSIPLTIVTQCGEEYATRHLKTIACGFGTGLAWATVYFETENIVCPEIVIYKQ